MELELLNRLKLLVAICDQNTLSPIYSTVKFKTMVGECAETIFNQFEIQYKQFSRQQALAVDAKTPYSFILQLKDDRTRKAIKITISKYNENQLMIVGEDITELKKLEYSLRSYSSIMEKQEKSLRKIAYSDSLTGIANRRAMFKQFDDYIQDKDNVKSSICILDIDHFKQFNDTYGHSFGDYALKYFAEKVNLALDDDCYFARIGGEEFCIFSYTRNEAELNTLMNRVLNLIKNCDIHTPHQTITQISFSAGITEYKKHGTTLNELLSNADKALYFAKATGRCRVISFSTELFQKRGDSPISNFREVDR
jgi:diguanylate cyclase (GGDEF)-like protein